MYPFARDIREEILFKKFTPHVTGASLPPPIHIENQITEYCGVYVEYYCKKLDDLSCGLDCFNGELYEENISDKT